MHKYQEWAKREQGDKQQFITLAIAGFLIVLLIPFLILLASAAIDQRLGLPDFYAGPINLLVGVIMIIGGLALGLWSIYAQITIGQGTPVPLMPTRKMVVQPPFTYCRNPMTLGTYIAYLGLCAILGSISALVIVLFLIILLLLYIKLFEEKELEARFGEEYLEYKHSTPFMLPRFRKNNS
jgi:protein-S-isoprenylcysteine O-methyltransferase Ste14